ncbi:MAG TPA: hypothetical protein VNN09_00060, partial [Candidatus Competibacteraceae bacterium]|nr:hypothetical protein [Candidatus Competibacteraceae bacterium]
EIGGLCLAADGAESLPEAVIRVGLGYRQLRRLAADGGAVLLAGAQPRRVEAVLAALRGGLVAVLVSDPGFAWALLRRQAESAA